MLFAKMVNDAGSSRFVFKASVLIFDFNRKQNEWNQRSWLMEKRKDRSSVAVQALLKQVTFSPSSWMKRLWVHAHGGGVFVSHHDAWRNTHEAQDPPRDYLKWSQDDCEKLTYIHNNNSNKIIWSKTYKIPSKLNSIEIQGTNLLFKIIGLQSKHN